MQLKSYSLKKNIALFILLSLFQWQKTDAQDCNYYSEGQSGGNSKYNLSSIEYKNITDNSVTISALFWGNCAYLSQINKTRFGLAYDSVCSNVYALQNPPWGSYSGYSSMVAPFPSISIATVDTLINGYFTPYYKNAKGVIVDKVTKGPNLEFKVKITGLKANTKYYLRWFVQEFTEGDGGPSFTFTYLGGKSTFTTKSKPIINNHISDNQFVCPVVNDGLLYTAAQINGTLPAGGTGNYSYLWQYSDDGGANWYQSGQNNNQQNYTPMAFSIGPMAPTPQAALHRRIVSSGSLNDTSNTVTITYLPQNYSPTINIWQVDAAKMSLNLQIGLTATGPKNFQVSLADSLLNTIKNPTITPVTGNIVTIQNNNNGNHVYNALINLNNGCPIFRSQNIYVTPKDGDYNIYAAVQIGKQFWTITNSRATKFNDGTPIQNFITGTKDTAKFSWYNNDSTNYALKYGALYNQSVIQNAVSKNVCPVNWKPAGFNDWIILFNSTQSQVVGNGFKSPTGWNGTTSPSDAYNFNAKPSGQMDSNGNFTGDGFWAIWWAIMYSGEPDKSTFNNYNNQAVKLNSTGNTSFAEPAKQNAIRCVGGY